MSTVGGGESDRGVEVSGQGSSLRRRAAPTNTVPISSVVQLKLLGGFELEVERRRLHVAPHVQRLLAFLALHDRPLHRAYVSGGLWIDASQEQAFGALRTTLWRIRRVPEPVVEATSTHLALASSVAVDARELAASAERTLHHRNQLDSDDVERLAEAGELLPDWYDDWVLQRREQLRLLRLLALEAVCEELAAAGRHTEAAIAALAAVAADPLRESARRLLIGTCLGAGNRAEAVRQFVDFRARLQRELGLEPSPRMLDLLRAFGSPDC